MSYFAKVEPTATANLFTVVDVISADQEFIDSGLVGPANEWFQTSYNTYGNVHYAPSPPAAPMTPDGGTPLRANYAGIGYTFDTSFTENDVVGVFYEPQPYPSWILNTATFLWEAPEPYPVDGNRYVWDEDRQTWVLGPTP